MPINEVTPSLGELSNAVQSGAPVPDTAVTNNNELVQTLNQNARFKAQNDWNKYLNFQNNLKDAYANTAAVEQMEVLSDDKPEIQKDAAQLYSFIAKNPDAFSGKNQQLAGELQGMYGNLLSKATLSKQDNLYDKAHRNFLLTNNELNTDTNKKVVDEFAKQPLGSRKAYNLSLDPIFDANAFSTTLKDQIEKQYSPDVKTTQVGFDKTTGLPVPGEGYLKETTTSKIPYQDYISKWDSALSMQADKNNQPIKNWAIKQYDTLPEDIKKKVPLEKFWHTIGEKMYGGTTDEKGNVKDIVKNIKEDIKADPNYLKKQTLAQLDKSLDETRRHNKVMEGLGWEKIKSGNADDDEEASGTITQINSVIEDATRPENLKFVIDPKGNRQQMGTLSDPELLKKYSSIDKEGRATNPADDALVDRTSGQVSLVYYKHDDDGNTVKSPQGAAIVEKSVPVNTSTWVSSVVARNESAKNKGKVINIVQKFYDKNGGIYKTARKVNQDRAKQDTTQTGTVPAKGIQDYAPEIQSGIQAVMKKNNISEAEAIKALKAAGKLD